MNKKTILAYVLIGLVIIGYFKLNQKSPEDIQREKARQERIAQKKQQEMLAEQERAYRLQQQFESIKNDSTNIFHNIYNGVEKPIVLSNDKVSITISTLGGRITSASLKDYKDQQGNDVVLFDSKDKLKNSRRQGDNRMAYTFKLKPELGNINTEQCYFAV